jgi:hypothetical protein
MMTIAKVSHLHDDGSEGWMECDVDRFMVTVEGVHFDLMMTYSRTANSPDDLPSYKVSDYKTGWSFVPSIDYFVQQLKDQGVKHPKFEQIGECVIRACVEKYGMQKVLDTIANKPVLNEW